MHRHILEYKIDFIDGKLVTVDSIPQNVIDAVAAGHDVVLVHASRGKRYRIADVNTETGYPTFAHMGIETSPMVAIFVKTITVTPSILVEKDATINCG